MSAQPRHSFKLRDQYYLKRFDNPESNPTVQIFDDSEDEDEESLVYYCAVCKDRLEYLYDIEEWFCNGCGQHYNTRFQDTPVKNTKDFTVKPWIDRYPTMDAEDPNMPFMAGKNPDKEVSNPDVELIKTSPDERVKHIRVRGSLTDAWNVI
jgi:hypothetical protein